MFKQFVLYTSTLCSFLFTTSTWGMDIIKDQVDKSDRRIEIVDKTGENGKKYFYFLRSKHIHAQPFGPIIRFTKNKDGIYAKRYFYATQFKDQNLLMFGSLKDMEWRRKYYIVNTDALQLQQDVVQYALIKDGDTYKLIDEGKKTEQDTTVPKPTFLEKIIGLFKTTSSKHQVKTQR